MAVSPPTSRRLKPQAPQSSEKSFRTNARSKSHLFQPPQTPKNLSSTDSSGSLHGSRKRTRPGPSPVQAAPWSVNSSSWTHLSAASSIARSDAMSPQPFVNTQYTLKDGLETPHQEIDSGFDNDMGDKEFRKCWATEGEGEDAELRDHNLYASSINGSPGNGWGKFVFNFAGVVAGKMWNFCTAVPFRGFYAGGGEGVPLRLENHESLQQASSMWQREFGSPAVNNSSFTTRDDQIFDRTMTPIPGQYPTEDPFAHDDITPPRPAKRMHTDAGASWMLVPSRGVGDCESISHRKTPLKSSIPRPRPSLPAQQPAPSRRSLIPVSRRSSLAAVPQIQSPSLRPASRQSNISPRPRNYTPSNPFAPYAERPFTPSLQIDENKSPLSPEAKEYVERMREEEEVADESMRNMSQRLADLIREGERALKSKYDSGADEEMRDEGFEEGYY